MNTFTVICFKNFVRKYCENKKLITINNSLMFIKQKIEQVELKVLG